jgi:hypothetical protein
LRPLGYDELIESINKTDVIARINLVSGDAGKQPA